MGRAHHNWLGHDVVAMQNSPGFAVLVYAVEWAAIGKPSYTCERKKESR
ncbi:MAG: hypothetical protein ABGY75_13000 [Gemmataceae bacterium]